MPGELEKRTARSFGIDPVFLARLVHDRIIAPAASAALPEKPACGRLSQPPVSPADLIYSTVKRHQWPMHGPRCGPATLSGRALIPDPEDHKRCIA